MIVGARKWADRNTYYTQENNIAELWLKLFSVPHPLQTCGASAAANCAAAVGYDLTTRTPGGWVVSGDDALILWFSAPVNAETIKHMVGIDPSEIPASRYAALYPMAAVKVFGACCSRITAVSKDIICGWLRKSYAVQACISPPGHYLAIVAYDEATGELIYNDSWSTRKAQWGGDGFNRRLTSVEETTLVPEAVVWAPPKE